MSEQPLFYAAADGMTVRKRPVRTGTETQLGFPVCKVSEIVGPDAAETVAQALNEYFGTPEPWRRTPAQQVQDLHLEVDRQLTAVRQLREVVRLADVMRQAQRAYFRTRDQADLIKSKTAERAFDAALHTLHLTPSPGQTGRASAAPGPDTPSLSGPGDEPGERGRDY